MRGVKKRVSGYRFGFNGQEKDDEIFGSSGTSYTAEFWQYDSRLGRRWNLDPKPNPSISRYAAFAGNPILYSDVKGDTVRIRGKDGSGNQFSHDYVPGGTYDGDNQFIQDVYTSLNHILENDADPTGQISQAVESEMVLDVLENNKENNPLFNVPDANTYFSDNAGGTNKYSDNPYLIYDPKAGLKFNEWKQTGIVSWLANSLFGDVGYRSPSEGLFHEVGHFVSYQENPAQHIIDSKAGDIVFDLLEERQVITKIENVAAEKLGGLRRKHHQGEIYETTSPTSTEPANP